MYLPVVSEVVLPPERLTTVVTGVGPLVCVCTLVDHQIVRLAELTATVTTHVVSTAFSVSTIVVVSIGVDLKIQN